MNNEKFGIYLNVKTSKIARINSPYWIPSGEEWVLVTPEVNMTLLKMREIAREKKLVPEPEKINWGEFPKLDK